MCFERILIICAALAPLPAAGQSGGYQWLIEKMEGKWEIQDEGQAARPLAGKYEILVPSSKVRCVESAGGPTSPTAASKAGKKKAPEPPPNCTLKYTLSDGQTADLPVTPKLNVWISLSEIAPPQGPPVAPTSAELLMRGGRRAGRTKAADGCGGSLPLQTPQCGETVDPVDFKLKWSTMPEEAGKLLTLVVGSLDTAERKRWNSIDAARGEFGAETLSKFLTGLQGDHPVDVTLRLMRSERLDVIRLVRLPAQAEETAHHKELMAASQLSDLARNLRYLAEYVRIGMWSKAADVSEQLRKGNPASSEVLKFVMVGFCQASLPTQIEDVRRSLNAMGVNASCESPATPTEGPKP
jgi:hypothetical protein